MDRNFGIIFYYWQPEGVFEPPINFYETDEDFVIQVALAGVKKEDVKVFFRDGEIVIQGFRVFDFGEGEKKFYNLEIEQGKFEKRISVGYQVEVDKISSKFENGLLEIKIPKKKPKEIIIE